MSIWKRDQKRIRRKLRPGMIIETYDADNKLSGYQYLLLYSTSIFENIEKKGWECVMVASPGAWNRPDGSLIFIFEDYFRKYGKIVYEV